MDDTQVGVSAPIGYTGPWPTLDMDGGDPSSWLATYNADNQNNQEGSQ